MTHGAVCSLLCCLLACATELNANTHTRSQHCECVLTDSQTKREISLQWPLDSNMKKMPHSSLGTRRTNSRAITFHVIYVFI